MPRDGFAWDENKRAINLEKHGIDFRDAIGIFAGPHLTTKTIRNDEIRMLASVGSPKASSRSFGPIEPVSCGSSPREQRGEMNDRSSRRGSVPERQPGVTDLARIAALSDAEIAAAVAEDPDAAPLDIDWSRAEVVVPPRKVAVSIRLDADILDYFKDGGDGYQSRINAVLRSYVRACTAGKT